MRFMTRLKLVALFAVFSCGYGLSQPGPGGAASPTEAILIDPSGTRLLGHGLFGGQKLVLDLADDTRDFVLLVVNDDGTMERLIGWQTAAGELFLQLPGGGAVGLTEFFARRGFGLVLVRAEAGRGQPPAPGAGGDQPATDDGAAADDPDADEDDDSAEEDQQDEQGDEGDELDDQDEDDEQDDQDQDDQDQDDEQDDPQGALQGDDHDAEANAAGAGARDGA